MSKKLNIVTMAAALTALVAVSAAFAFTGKPEAATPNVKVASPALASAAKHITPEQAKEAALAAKPGTVGEVELEEEDGRSQYSVEITAKDGKKYDVEVDADTGKVLKIEVEDDDEETNDDK